MRFDKLSADNEWYTPNEYIHAARQIMGTIDLDPASNERAQSIIQAKAYYTSQDDGLAQLWQGSVWMNPPYSRELLPKFMRKLFEGIEDGTISQATVLCIASTSSRWWQRAAAMASVSCHLNHRVQCYGPSNIADRPAHCSTLFYFGDRTKAAIRILSQFGVTFSSPVDTGKRYKCEQCKIGISGRSHRKYCSTKCRVAAYRKRSLCDHVTDSTEEPAKCD